MTGEEMERAIEFLLQNQGQLNQTLTTAITTLAEFQLKTEAKVDRLADVVGQLVERRARMMRCARRYC